MTDPSPPKEGIRWPLAVGFTLVGLGVIALGLLLAHVIESAIDAPYWSGVAVNIGTTLLLAAILVVFERALIKRTQAAVRRETEPLRQQAEETREQTVRLAEETSQDTARLFEENAAFRTQIETRLSALDEQMAARNAEALREERQLVEAIDREVTRDTVLGLMRRAATFGALALAWDHQGEIEGSGRITVLAGPTVAAPPIMIEYIPERPDTWNDSGPEGLVLRYPVQFDAPEVEWTEDTDALTVFTALEDEMIRTTDAGIFVREIRLGDYFNNLRSGVDLAILRRRGIGDFWILGSPVLEVIAPGWVITHKGIEVVEHGVVVAADRFGHNLRDLDHWNASPNYVDRNLPERSDDLDPMIWDRAIERGAVHFEEPAQDWPW